MCPDQSLGPFPWESAKAKYWSSAENAKRTAEHSKVWQDRVFRNIKIRVVPKCGGLLQKSLLGQRKYQLLGNFAWCEGLLIGLWLFFFVYLLKSNLFISAISYCISLLFNGRWLYKQSYGGINQVSGFVFSLALSEFLKLAFFLMYYVQASPLISAKGDLFGSKNVHLNWKFRYLLYRSE